MNIIHYIRYSQYGLIMSLNFILFVFYYAHLLIFIYLIFNYDSIRYYSLY